MLYEAYMGSAFYSMDDAARRLNVTRRSVFNYIKKGFLKRHMLQGRPMLDKEDVDDLAVRLGSDAPAMTRQAWNDLQGRLRKLEHEMVTVKQILEMRGEPPLRPNPTMARAIHAAADSYRHANEDILLTPGTSPDWNQWATVFDTIDESTLDIIAQATETKNCWYPIFEFCNRLLDIATKQNEKQPSLEWQARAARLSACRQKLRGIIVMWIEAGRDDSPKADSYLLLDSRREDVIRRLTAKSPSTSG